MLKEDNKNNIKYSEEFKQKFEEVFDKLIMPIEDRTTVYECYKKWLKQQEIKQEDESEENYSNI